MKIYKAGMKYFSTYREAEIYRKKYFNSTRYIETIEVESGTIKETDEIVARIHWYKSDKHSIKLHVRSCWCIGALSDYLNTDSYLNMMHISRIQPDIVFVDVSVAFRSMGAARYWSGSKKTLDLIESEIAKVRVGTEAQIKI